MQSGAIFVVGLCYRICAFMMVWFCTCQGVLSQDAAGSVVIGLTAYR